MTRRATLPSHVQVRTAGEAARRPTLPPLLLADLTARQRKIIALLPTIPES
ncbi:hypothetical protein G7043_39850 [Lentzea sp. NEAU-D13]|uniref:Uncharacterized protein n=1 Tax=Lentzea alba TaxID=2714351 RepID=A0A7C9RWI6_9PSEU|nr:hypothetical protein [Lentzea alba]NGY65085.1 hypothetical protein [Lentzea alba]